MTPFASNTISGKVNLIAHSQGTITASNALLNLGVKGKMVVNSTTFLAPAITQARAGLTAGLAGSTFTYGANTFDVINIVGPNLNPVKFGGGLFGGLVFQAKYHTLDQY